VEAAHAKIVSEPEDKPWKLREFMAAHLDGNLIRVFYDFRGDTFATDLLEAGADLRTIPSPTKNTQANLRRTDRATFSDAGRVLDRVRVVARKQGAHSVESCHIARLDELAAGLAGSREIPVRSTCATVFVHCRLGDDRTGMMVAAYGPPLTLLELNELCRATQQRGKAAPSVVVSSRTRSIIMPCWRWLNLCRRALSSAL
jgi:hypothetical protein